MQVSEILYDRAASFRPLVRFSSRKRFVPQCSRSS